MHGQLWRNVLLLLCLPLSQWLAVSVSARWMLRRAHTRNVLMLIVQSSLWSSVELNTVTGHLWQVGTTKSKHVHTTTLYMCTQSCTCGYDIMQYTVKVTPHHSLIHYKYDTIIYNRQMTLVVKQCLQHHTQTAMSTSGFPTSQHTMPMSVEYMHIQTPTLPCSMFFMCWPNWFIFGWPETEIIASQTVVRESPVDVLLRWSYRMLFCLVVPSSLLTAKSTASEMIPLCLRSETMHCASTSFMNRFRKWQRTSSTAQRGKTYDTPLT